MQIDIRFRGFHAFLRLSLAWKSLRCPNFPTPSVEHPCLLWSTYYYKSKMGCECIFMSWQWPFSVCICQTFLYRNKGTSPGFAGGGEKTVKPSPSNSAPHLHADSSQSEAWKQDASVQKGQRDLRETAEGQGENQSCGRGKAFKSPCLHWLSSQTQKTLRSVGFTELL